MTWPLACRRLEFCAFALNKTIYRAGALEEGEVPDAFVKVPQKHEQNVDSDDASGAETDKRKRKSRLLKGWRMTEAPTLTERAVLDARTWGSERTRALKPAPKTQASWAGP